MVKSQRKSTSFLTHPLVVVFFTVLCLLMSFSLYQSRQTAEVSRESLENLEQTTQQLEEQVQKKEREATLKSTSFAQEKAIRDSLLQKKEGETILQIPAVEEASPTPNPSPTPPSAWQAWKALLL